MTNRFFGLFMLLIVVTYGCGPSTKKQAARQNQFGVYCAKQQLWEEAEFRWERAIDLDSNNWKVINNLAVAAIEKGEFQKALDYLQRAIRLVPDNSKLQNNLRALKSYLDKRTTPSPKSDRAVPNKFPPDDRPDEDLY